MSTWEQDMSARAHQRAAAGRERQRAREAERMRLEAIATLFGARAALLAAEPNPCAQCYTWWGVSLWRPAGSWGHVTEAVVPGAPPPDGWWDYADKNPAHWCDHACHEGAPCYTIPPAMAA